jgi:hypothetical protein
MLNPSKYLESASTLVGKQNLKDSRQYEKARKQLQYEQQQCKHGFEDPLEMPIRLQFSCLWEQDSRKAEL